MYFVFLFFVSIFFFFFFKFSEIKGGSGLGVIQHSVEHTQKVIK